LTAAFVLHAAMAEIYDVQAARLALNKGQSPDLRAFAAVLIKDHTDAAGEMRAATGGFPEPKALDPEHQMLIDRLNEISDHDFDALVSEATGQRARRWRGRPIRNSWRKRRTTNWAHWPTNCLGRSSVGRMPWAT
jgi:predicted outer membrane protein